MAQPDNKTKKNSATGFTLEDLEAVELPQLDLTEFVGKKVKIVSATIHESENFDKLSYYLKVETEKVTELTNSKKEVIPVVASRLFGLFMTEDGVPAWGTQSKLAAFLASMKLSNPAQLIGKTVTVQLGEPNKAGKRFLTF